MITVIARWESVQMDSHLEHRIMRQLKGAYAVGDSVNFRLIYVPIVDSMSVEQYDTMEEALTHATGQICFLEPNGVKCVSEIKEKDITLILGNTEKSNMKHADIENTYKINTPKSTDMYGLCALSIALHHWWFNQ